MCETQVENTDTRLRLVISKLGGYKQVGAILIWDASRYLLILPVLSTDYMLAAALRI